MRIRLTDALTLDGKPRKTKDGYLVATALIARTGIQQYAGFEMGVADKEIINVLRPEQEVFNDAALASIAHKPMTNNHPDERVTADNWRELSVGQVGAEVARDGDYIRVPLALMDSQAIADYEKGKVELSLGYDCDIEWKEGVTDTGEIYHAIQRNIRINHLALVDKARAGDKARIGDKGGQKEQPENHDGAFFDMRKIIHDGITIEVSEQAAEVIAELNKRVQEAQAKTAEAEVATEDAKKELAKKDAEIDALKAEKLTPEQLDKLIADLVALIAQAKKIADVEYTGDANAIKKQALTALLGDAMAAKDATYIDARFDIEFERAQSNDQGGQQTQGTGTNDSSNADAKYQKKLTEAWKV